MSVAITRRKLLKLIAATTAASALSPVFHARARYPLPPEPDGDDKTNSVYFDYFHHMGRAIHTITLYDQPSTSAERIGTRRRDQSVFILREVRAPYSAHNDLWYKTLQGYVHSAWVLPMRVYPPQPFISDIGEWGFWGEVCQVFAEAYAQPNAQSRRVYRFYGGNVLHVVEGFKDDHGAGWYKVYDEFPPTNPSHQWLLARDVRRIPRKEMAPIHPFAGEKRIEVDIAQQRLTCYEGTQLVFSAPVATGMPGATATPLGEKGVILKQPSRHMCNYPYPGGPEPLGDLFDLPGIPWNTFFDLSGTAIHGTYWHNDFGIQRSHGCVNVSQEVARWVYRWAYPVGGFEDDFVQGDWRVGTPIIIF